MTIRILALLIFFLAVIQAALPWRWNVARTNDMVEQIKSVLDRQEHDMLNKLHDPHLSDQERTDIADKLGRVYWQKNKLHDAESFLEIAYKNRRERATSVGPDLDRFEDSALALGGVYRDSGKFLPAIGIYNDILGGDIRFLPADFKRLGRDYLNLGLVKYLNALAEPEKQRRFQLLVESNSDLEKAAQNYKQGHVDDPQLLANVFGTQYVVLRDLGHFSDSEIVRKEYERIHGLLKRPSEAP